MSEMLLRAARQTAKDSGRAITDPRRQQVHRCSPWFETIRHRYLPMYRWNHHIFQRLLYYGPGPEKFTNAVIIITENLAAYVLAGTPDE